MGGGWCHFLVIKSATTPPAISSSRKPKMCQDPRNFWGSLSFASVRADLLSVNERGFSELSSEKSWRSVVFGGFWKTRVLWIFWRPNWRSSFFFEITFPSKTKFRVFSGDQVWLKKRSLGKIAFPQCQKPLFVPVFTLRHKCFSGAPQKKWMLFLKMYLFSHFLNSSSYFLNFLLIEPGGDGLICESLNKKVRFIAKLGDPPPPGPSQNFDTRFGHSEMGKGWQSCHNLFSNNV